MTGKHRNSGRASRKSKTTKPKKEKTGRHAREETTEERRATAVGDTAILRDDAVRLIPPKKGKHAK